MSYNIDGKIVNQPIRRRLDGMVLCSCCSRSIKAPSRVVMPISAKTAIMVFHYVNSNYYIHETKKGYAVMYCSSYCRRKHNHRY